MTATPFEIFISYSRKDRAFLDDLTAQLSNLRRQNLIKDWNDGDLIAGSEWEPILLNKLNTAQIILLLISADFMNSDFCYTREMLQAIERHHRGEVRVIPILLRPTDWEGAPFAKLTILPFGAKPITTWERRDDAYYAVIQGIRKAIKELQDRQPNP